MPSSCAEFLPKARELECLLLDPLQQPCRKNDLITVYRWQLVESDDHLVSPGIGRSERKDVAPIHVANTHAVAYVGEESVRDLALRSHNLDGYRLMERPRIVGPRKQYREPLRSVSDQLQTDVHAGHHLVVSQLDVHVFNGSFRWLEVAY